jgi:hypothetical protein
MWTVDERRVLDDVVSPKRDPEEEPQRRHRLIEDGRRLWFVGYPDSILQCGKRRPPPVGQAFIQFPRNQLFLNAAIAAPRVGSKHSTVMAITKCRIWLPPVNQFTGTARELRQCARTSDWMGRRSDGERS